MKRLIDKLKSLSLSSQIFLIFSSFIILIIFIQFTVYSIMFSDYVINQQKKEARDILSELVDELRFVDDSNYYDILLSSSQSNDIINVVLDENFNIVEQPNKSLSMMVTDVTTYENFEIMLPSELDIEVSDRVNVGVIIDPNSNRYDLYSLTVNNEVIYESDNSAIEVINGIVTEIIRPLNLNEIHKNNQLVTNQLFFIRNNNIISNLINENESYSYDTNTEFAENLVFLHRINDSDYLLSISVLQNNNNLFGILATYNLIIYASILILAVIISFIVANMISKPIKNIDNVAKEIADFNFNIFSNETNSLETKSLSDNINKISHNLSSNINVLQKNNDEMAKILEHQSTQANIRKRFIQAISHELKTPLMVINLSVQGIIDGIFEEGESEEELKHILLETSNIDSLVKDLLDVYRLEDTSLKEEKINLKTVTEQAIQSVDNLLKQYDQEVSFASARSPIIYGDKKQITMCISNIITNALKYTPNGESIKINIFEKKEKIVFNCTNYGVTIPEDKLPHLTEAFYRADESRAKSTKTKGSGLGLYIVNESLKAHGFDFKINNVNNGVQVQFTAPKY